MPSDDAVSAVHTLNDSEERSELLPYKHQTAHGLTAILAVIAAASTGAEAVVAATVAGFFAVAADFIGAARERRVKEFVSYLHEEFHRRGVTKERLEQRFESADEKVQELLAEAVVRAAEAKSTERVRRIALLLTSIVLSREGIQVEESRVMLEIAGSLFDMDAFILGEMYGFQHVVVEKRKGHPELNEVTESWRKLRQAYPQFREGSVNSSCARLQSQGLAMRVEPGMGQFDLETYVSAITEFGIRFCRWRLRDIN